MKLDGRVVVITGAGHGIGAAFAERFSAEGAKVVVTDIDAAALARVTEAIGCPGLAVDIAEEENVRAVAALARDACGEIDIWYSNAGFAGPRQPGEIPDNHLWDLGWNLHVMSHVYAAREVLPSMLQRGDGYLLQTASVVALSSQVEKGSYTVTKHAALALAEWLAITYRPKGIKVSCFCPGPMLTRMLLSNDFPPDHPVMKMALTPESVADLLVAAIDEERFLITENPAASESLNAKGADYDRWIAGMAEPRLS